MPKINVPVRRNESTRREMYRNTTEIEHDKIGLRKSELRITHSKIGIEDMRGSFVVKVICLTFDGVPPWSSARST